MSEGKQLDANYLKQLFTEMARDPFYIETGEHLRGHIAALESERDTLRGAILAYVASTDVDAEDYSLETARQKFSDLQALARLAGDGGQGTVAEE